MRVPGDAMHARANRRCDFVASEARRLADSALDCTMFVSVLSRAQPPELPAGFGGGGEVVDALDDEVIEL